jgi:hypothetical protein
MLQRQFSAPQPRETTVPVGIEDCTVYKSDWHSLYSPWHSDCTGTVYATHCTLQQPLSSHRGRVHSIHSIESSIKHSIIANIVIVVCVDFSSFSNSLRSSALEENTAQEDTARLARRVHHHRRRHAVRRRPPGISSAKASSTVAAPSPSSPPGKMQRQRHWYPTAPSDVLMNVSCSAFVVERRLCTTEWMDFNALKYRSTPALSMTHASSAARRARAVAAVRVAICSSTACIKKILSVYLRCL